MYSMWTKVLHLFETSQMKRMLKVLCQVAIPYKINLKKNHEVIIYAISMKF